MNILKSWLLFHICLWSFCSGSPVSKKQLHLRHLRDELDKAILKQKIDHIYLNELKESVEKLYYDSQHSEDEISTLAENFKGLNSDVENLKHGSSKESPKLQINPSDGFTIEAYKELKDDFLQLKSEIEKIKLNCMASKEEDRTSKEEDRTVSWILQVIPDLQRSVRDIQQSTNLIKEMHTKKDLDIKLSTITNDVSCLQERILKLTTGVEASAAIAQSLIEETSENSVKIHQLQNKEVIMQEKVQEQVETVDNLLKNLPDGFLQQTRNTSEIFSIAAKIIPMKFPPKDKDLNRKLEKLELKTASLDFALMQLQKKEYLKQSEKEDVTSRITIFEDEMKKMKQDSQSLMEIVNDVENEEGEVKARTRRFLSQFQSKLDKERHDRISSDEMDKISQKELQREEHSDIFEFKRILNSLTNRINQSSKDQNSCFTKLEKRINEVEELLHKDIFSTRRKRKRHHHSYS